MQNYNYYIILHGLKTWTVKTSPLKNKIKNTFKILKELKTKKLVTYTYPHTY